MWESDNQATGFAKYTSIVQQGYQVIDLDKRTVFGEISNVMSLETGLADQSIPKVFYHLLRDEDRPIGVGKDTPDVLNDLAQFVPVGISVTRAVMEQALAGAYGQPGLIPIRFVDHKINGQDTITQKDFGGGNYTITLRVTRLP